MTNSSSRGRCEEGIYILEQGNKAFLAALKNKETGASFEIWHSKLRHVAFDIVTLLEKLGSLSLASVLPKPGICSST